VRIGGGKSERVRDAGETSVFRGSEMEKTYKARSPGEQGPRLDRCGWGEAKGVRLSSLTEAAEGRLEGLSFGSGFLVKSKSGAVV
jgi:hypothetical protein